MKLPIENFPSDLVRTYEPVGSQVTCNPAPSLEESDIDWLVYVWHADIDKFTKELTDNGWTIGGSKPEDADSANGFNSFTKTVDGLRQNVVATANYNFYMKFMRATTLAKKLNLLNKDDRIELFHAILYGE